MIMRGIALVMSLFSFISAVVYGNISVPDFSYISKEGNVDKVVVDQVDNIVTNILNTSENANAEESLESSLKTPNTSKTNLSKKLKEPQKGIYLGAFADFGPTEDNVTVEKIKKFEKLVGKNIGWAYFSDNWFNGISFPKEQVTLLKTLGVTPYIRIMPRMDFREQPEDSEYSLERIAEGNFENELRLWASDAKSSDVPLIVEFGTEVNGDWFPWNGRWNGGGATKEYKDSTKPDGPERFIDAYRYIVGLFNDEGATNITWVYHVNSLSKPNSSWNTILQYYPGDAYIDWIGVSVYGAQSHNDGWVSFSEVFDDAYRTITSMTDKPIALVEVGVAESQQGEKKAQWLKEMFTLLESGAYERVKGLSFWHSSWTDGNEVINLKVNSSETALNELLEELAHGQFYSELEFLDL